MYMIIFLTYQRASPGRTFTFVYMYYGDVQDLTKYLLIQKRKSKNYFSFDGCSSLECYNKKYPSVGTGASAYICTSVLSTHKTCCME